MAERKLTGSDVVLMIDPDGGTDYDLIVCLTANSKEITNSEIDAASKCGPDKLPGEQTASVTFTGQVVSNPDSGRVSEADLFTLVKDQTRFSWKQGPAIPKEGDAIYTGMGFLSSFSDSYDLGSPGTFTGTIGVSGSITQTITPAPIS